MGKMKKIMPWVIMAAVIVLIAAGFIVDNEYFRYFVTGTSVLYATAVMYDFVANRRKYFLVAYGTRKKNFGRAMISANGNLDISQAEKSISERIGDAAIVMFFRRVSRKQYEECLSAEVCLPQEK